MIQWYRVIVLSSKVAFESLTKSALLFVVL